MSQCTAAYRYYVKGLITSPLARPADQHTRILNIEDLICSSARSHSYSRCHFNAALASLTQAAVRLAMRDHVLRVSAFNSFLLKDKIHGNSVCLVIFVGE